MQVNCPTSAVQNRARESAGTPFVGLKALAKLSDPPGARRGRKMIDLLTVEEPKPKPAKMRAVSYEAAIDQLFKTHAVV